MKPGNLVTAPDDPVVAAPRLPRAKRITAYEKPPFKLVHVASRKFVCVRFLDPASNTYGPFLSSGQTSDAAAGAWARIEVQKRQAFGKLGLASPTVYGLLEHFWDDDGDYAKANAADPRAEPYAPGYLRTSRNYCKNWVLTYRPFKSIRACDLTPAILATWKAWIRSQPSPRSLNHKKAGDAAVHGAFQALSRAVNYYFLSQNVTPPRLSIPKTQRDKEKEDRQKTLPITYEQGLTFFALDVNKGGGKTPGHAPTGPGVKGLPRPIDPRIKIAIILGAYCGLRIGEVVALRWEKLEVDAWKKRLLVDVQRASGQKEESGPKWGSVRRTLVIPQVETLLDEFAKQSPYGKKGYVLANWAKTCETPIGDHTLRNGYALAKAQLGIDPSLRFHDLRHYFVSYCQIQGIPIADIAALTGQKDLKVAAIIYNHSILGDKAIIERLQAPLGPVPAASGEVSNA